MWNLRSMFSRNHGSLCNCIIKRRWMIWGFLTAWLVCRQDFFIFLKMLSSCCEFVVVALLYCVQNIRKPQNGRGSTQIGGIKYVYNNYSNRLIHNCDVCEEQEDRILNIDSQEDQDMISFAILGGEIVTIAVGTIIYGMCFASFIECRKGGECKLFCVKLLD